MWFKLQLCFFLNMGTLVFGAQMLRISMSSQWILTLSIQYPSLFLLISFGLRSILSDIKMATQVHLLGIFFHYFTLRSILMLRYISWLQWKGRSCFRIHSINLCLWGGETMDVESSVSVDFCYFVLMMCPPPPI